MSEILLALVAALVAVDDEPDSCVAAAAAAAVPSAGPTGTEHSLNLQARVEIAGRSPVARYPHEMDTWMVRHPTAGAPDSVSGPS